MANASSDRGEFNLTHGGAETLLKTKDDRITELEACLAEKDKLLVEVTRWTQEEAPKLLNLGKLLNFFKGQATKDPDVLTERRGKWDLQRPRGSGKRDLERLGGFPGACHVLHMNMSLDMRLPWLLFLPILRKEGSFFGEQRWSGPLHRLLAEHLKKWAISMEDWDLSILRKDNGDPIYSAREEDDAVIAACKNPMSPSLLSKEQICLVERIVIYYRAVNTPLRRSKHIPEDQSECNPGESSKRTKISPEDAQDDVQASKRTKISPEDAQDDAQDGYKYNVWSFWPKCTPEIRRKYYSKPCSDPEDWIVYNPVDWTKPMPVST